FAAGCDRHRDDPPPPAELPAPTPPPAESAPPPPTASAPPVAPPRVGVAKGAPDGVVADHWTAGGQCNIESINQAATGRPITRKAETPPRSVVWARDPKGTKVPVAVPVRFFSSTTGDFYGPASKRFVRDDVNAKFSVEPKTATSGFEMEFDSDQLPAGT